MIAENKAENPDWQALSTKKVPDPEFIRRPGRMHQQEHNRSLPTREAGYLSNKPKRQHSKQEVKFVEPEPPEQEAILACGAEERDDSC